MAGDYALEGLAVPDTLNLLHELLAAAGKENPDLPVIDLMMFETAVIEIAGNVVEHGLPPGGVAYHFRLSVDPERLQAVLTDYGLPVLRGVDVEMPDGSAESGRGLALAAAALDTFSYSRSGNRNCWQMTRMRH